MYITIVIRNTKSRCYIVCPLEGTDKQGWEIVVRLWDRRPPGYRRGKGLPHPPARVQDGRAESPRAPRDLETIGPFNLHCMLFVICTYTLSLGVKVLLRKYICYISNCINYRVITTTKKKTWSRQQTHLPFCRDICSKCVTAGWESGGVQGRGVTPEPCTCIIWRMASLRAETEVGIVGRWQRLKENSCINHLGNAPRGQVSVYYLITPRFQGL